MNKVIFPLLSGLLLAVLFLNSCKHNPYIPDGFDPENPNDTTVIPPVDTTTPGDPCDPNVIYFENNVLPILTSSCGVPGCHDPITREKDIVLVSYASTMASDIIDPGDAQDSEMYEDITDNDPDDKMPPPNSGISITQEQIAIIRDWINQGAQNLSCDNSANCDSVNVTFSGNINTLIGNYCRGCHSGNTPQGNVNLANYNAIKAIADDGRLLKVVTHAAGVTPMPYNQPKLNNCQIAAIRKWINDGALNN